jgi:hypothetical protein
MKILIAILFLITSSSVFGETPYDIYNTDKNFTEISIINWVQVDDIQTSCNQQREIIGLSPYEFKVEACSHWKKDILHRNVCNIITTRKVSMWTMGHELLHCFQGEYHK